jgi:DNA invertase Pin-like site-specific DNA recombinase
VDALYFRVSSDQQTTENQFEDLVRVAEKDGSGRDWGNVRKQLSECVREEEITSASGNVRTVFWADPDIVQELVAQSVYVEQGKSGRTKARKRRPLFEQMKRDAAMRRFDRVLIWKVARIGGDMREVISTVYELADMGVTVLPVKSETGPINSIMGKLLWAIQAWFAEFENEERSEAIRATELVSDRAPPGGQHRDRATGPPGAFRRFYPLPKLWRKRSMNGTDKTNDFPGSAPDDAKVPGFEQVEEGRDPRFAELDAQIAAENPTSGRRRRARRKRPGPRDRALDSRMQVIAGMLRQEFPTWIKRAPRTFRKRALRLLVKYLPPYPRPHGRPPLTSTLTQSSI